MTTLMHIPFLPPMMCHIEYSCLYTLHQYCEKYLYVKRPTGFESHNQASLTNMGGLLRDLLKCSLAYVTLSMNVSPQPSLTLLFHADTGLREG